MQINIVDDKLCNNCNKYFSNKYNLKRHLDICGKDKKYFCIFCETYFSRSYLLTQHFKICKCKFYKEKIIELENINKELIEKISKYESDNDNISLDDINVINFNITDILEYGKSIGTYICSNSYNNLLKKISLKNKKRKIIQYKIDNIIYNDNGLNLVIFVLTKLKDKIIELINDKYHFIDKDNILYNEHTKRIINIKNIEIDEIIEYNKQNELFEEIIKVIYDYIIIVYN